MNWLRRKARRFWLRWQITTVLKEFRRTDERLWFMTRESEIEEYRDPGDLFPDFKKLVRSQTDRLTELEALNAELERDRG